MYSRTELLGENRRFDEHRCHPYSFNWNK